MTQKEQTKENLVEAFWTLYKDKPLEKITVKEITDKAGYNRGTFYSYFKDTYEMQKYVRDSLLPDEHFILEPFKGLEDGTAKVFNRMEWAGEYFENNHDKIAVLFGPSGDPVFIHEFKVRVRNIIMGYLKDINVKDLEAIELMLEFHISALIGLFQLWVEKDKQISRAKLENIIEQISQEGIISAMEEKLAERK
jgi:AcrR family transcriptional regulator